MTRPGFGRTYTIREEPSPERIVRPFQTPASWPVPRRLPPEQDDSEALLEWGATVAVQVTTLESLFVNPRDLVEWADRELESDGDEGPQVVTLTETARSTSVVRVTNPTDPSSWVDVQRINQISFSDPEVGTRTYVLRPPRTQPPQFF